MSGIARVMAAVVLSTGAYCNHRKKGDKYDQQKPLSRTFTIKGLVAEFPVFGTTIVLAQSHLPGSMPQRPSRRPRIPTGRRVTK